MCIRCFILFSLGLLGALSGLTAEVAAPPRQEPKLLTNIRQLTLEGRRSGEGYFSTDGNKLLFQSEREAGNPFYQIYLLDLESGDTHRVSTGVGKTTCAFFRPGSSEVLFASTHLDQGSKQKQKEELEFRASGKERRYSWDYDEQMEIFSAKQDGTQIRNLTRSRGYDAEGAYSPDGKKIVFCSLRDAYTRPLSDEERKRLETDPAYFGELYIMDADGSNVKRLTDKPGYDGGPFFSPDGQRIVWRHFDEKGVVANVYTMRIDGSDVQQLTDFGSMSWAPYYHPSGKYIIFTSNKLGFSNFELYLVDVAGKREPVRVTDTDGFDGLPVFSPDGQKLCWTSARTADGKSQLFLANWNHEVALAELNASPLRNTAAPANLLAGRNIPPDPEAHLSPEIRQSDLRLEVGYLASDSLEGRMSGSTGNSKAAAFLANYLNKIGVQPVGNSNGYYQKFEFTSGVKVVTNQNRLQVKLPRQEALDFQVGKDFNPLSFTANGQAEGEVVFAGYGLVVPGKQGIGYNSYEGLDVSNKIVLVLRYVPEAVEPQRRQELNRYAGLRYKALMARERGAKAILFATGPSSPNAGELIGMSFDSSMAGSGIIAASVTSNLVQALLSGAGKDLKTLQQGLDTENPHAEGSLALPNTTVKIATGVEFIKKSDQNVLGLLLPAGNSREYIVVGAHYDHLGLGEVGAFERKGEEHQIHNGADDNASGVAAVLELAAALSAERTRQPENFQRGVLFAFWSGEEIGLMGSSHFVEHPPLPLTNALAYLNFDMVGRLRDNKLTLQGLGSSSIWRKLIEKRNVAAGFNLVLQDDPYLPTDTTAFYPRQVPVLSFFTGSHEDYHRPTDKPDTLNYEGLDRITRMARGLVLDLLKAPERPDYAKVTRSETGGARETLRAYLGTIPDYTAEVAGVKLSGVRAGSPADKAGLKGGDVLVEFGGQKIANIYDYTYALDAVKIGQPVTIAVQREGKRVALSVTPEARK